ncbi:MAG TPA: CAP domain-containing protein [Candidatus Sulfotelmatobacter sp.]|nr:CAP domain-containing protein [Candidatus Sulfotelmatobacter sp.]
MKNFLRHLFLPRTTNNYRPRILHHKILLILTLFFFSSGFLMYYVRNNYPSVLGTYSNISDQELLVLTNQKRQEAGLSPLSLNSTLSQAASSKASDMFGKDYWAHIAPDGTTPWVFIKSSGYNYVYAGENLARGYSSAPDVVNAWMASPEHRKNMLSSNYTDVGFAVSTGKLTGEDTVLVVEMLGSTSLASAPVANAETKPVQQIVTSQTIPTATATQPEPTLQPQRVNTLGVQKSTQLNKQAVVAQNPTSSQKPLINGLSLSLVSARTIVTLFIFILILDMVIIERKKIVRFVGHNLDHVLFFSLILIVLIILARGVII